MYILFVITNINGTWQEAYSFGLASLASIAKNKGVDYDYAVIGAVHEYDDFLSLIETKKPSVIAYTSVSSQYMFIKELSLKVKSEYKGKVTQVLGGVHATIFPDCAKEESGLDGIFIGEGEYAFSDFIDKISQEKDYHGVNNFAYTDSGKLIRNKLYPLTKCLDVLPYPERKKYGYGEYIKRNGCAIFMFSRGCPYSCSYCSNHAIAKVYGMKLNTPRYRSPKSSIGEIRKLIEDFGTTKISIGDDTFGLDKNWTREFCSIYAKEIRLPMMVQLRVNVVNEELMDSLKTAGCVHVSCGVEAGSDYLRNKIMKRNISKEQIINAYALFKKYGMSSNAINIIGSPHETIDNIWETIKLNRNINPDSSGVNIFYPYKGTQLGDYCFYSKLVNENEYRSFCMERRDSVLNYSDEYKKKLRYFYKNWHFLVYKYRFYKLIRPYMVRFAKKRLSIIWKTLRNIRRKYF